MMTSPTPARDSATTAPRVFIMDLLATVPYYTAYLSRALLAEGLPVQVGSISYYLDPECFRSRGLHLQPGLLDVVGRFASLPKALRRVLKLAEGALNLLALTLRFAVQPPSIVHVQYLPMLRLPVPLDAWFVRFCRWRGCRIVLTVHDLLPHDTAERYRSLYTRLYASVDGLICHSDHIRSRLLAEFGVPSSKVEVIPHGPFFFDLPASDPAAVRSAYDVAADQIMVLWQGIIFPYKGLDLLIEAWAAVEAQVPEAVLVVLGTGSPNLLANLAAQVETLGLRRVRLQFRFCTAEELVAAYRAADLVVYPYRAITTSGALATGLALGKTILATDLPVFRELLDDGVNATLVPPSNASTLGSTLCTMLQNEPMRAKLAQAVRSMNFGQESWSAIAAATAGFYRRLLVTR